MQIVIDIPEIYYEALKEADVIISGQRSGKTLMYDICSIIANGTPLPKWIPVSERLPEKQDCYLVTTKWKGSYSGDVYIETNMAVYREKPKEWDCANVIAWMSLPEPWKGEVSK